MTIEALVIHLARAAARKPHVERLKAELPLPVTIVDAVDAAKLSEAELVAPGVRRLHDPTYFLSMTKAEIACFLSHRRAWQTILDRDLDAALILEDDAGPTEGFKPALDLALAHIGKQGFIRFPIPRSVEAGEEIAVSGRAKLIKPRTIGLGMVAQLVSREAAQKLLKATERFDRPIDVVLQMPWVTGVFARSIVPSVVAEISADLGGTTLHRKGEPALAKLRREILRPLYRGRIALRSRFFTREPA